jgi:hypothetical protein
MGRPRIRLGRGVAAEDGLVLTESLSTAMPLDQGRDRFVAVIVAPM